MVSPLVQSKDEMILNKIISGFSSRQVPPPLSQLLRFPTSRHYIISAPSASNPKLATERLQPPAGKGNPSLTSCTLNLSLYHLIDVHI